MSDQLIIERSLPVADVEIAEHRLVSASPGETYAAARSVDFLDVRSPLVDAAMWVRGLPPRLKGEPPPTVASMRLSDALESGEMNLPGWLILGEQSGHDVAFGAVGRFWKPDIEWRDVPRHEFDEFAEPGWGKIAAGFSVVPYSDDRTLLTYACRVSMTDADSRRRFRTYWLVVQPFVARIFRATLATIAASAESTVSSSP
ncbi:MAG: hypothetical protein ACXIVQ_13995 [Acidimicrobiales bacterium]